MIPRLLLLIGVALILVGCAPKYDWSYEPPQERETIVERVDGECYVIDKSGITKITKTTYQQKVDGLHCWVSSCDENFFYLDERPCTPEEQKAHGHPSDLAPPAHGPSTGTGKTYEHCELFPEDCAPSSTSSLSDGPTSLFRSSHDGN